MRCTTDRPDPRASNQRLFGAPPSDRHAVARQHEPAAQPDSPRLLRARADQLLAHLRRLDRASLGGSRIDIDRIDEIIDQLQALEDAFAAAVTRRPAAGQVVEVMGARRSLTAALLLTYGMLERLP